MSKTEKQPTYAELVREIVRESRDPITLDEIVQRVLQLRQVNSKNPKPMVRNALAQCWMIVDLGEGKYGWYPRLIAGSRARVPLITYDGELERIVFDDDALQLLWPAFFDNPGSSGNRDPVDLQLPDGAHTSFPLELFERGTRRIWGSTASKEFWRWLKRCKAASGDALIIETVDAEARTYSVMHEPRRKRDAAAIRKSTREIEIAAVDYIWISRNRDRCPTIWRLTRQLLGTGCYKKNSPPEPASCIWRRVSAEAPQPPDFDEPAIRWLRAASPWSRTVYQLKILLSGSKPPIWRRVQVADTATLGDLHRIIQQSMGWADCHLHQFIIDGEYYSDPVFELDDDESEMPDECLVTLGDVAEWKPDRFFYEYDFGDRWFHEIVIEKSERYHPGEFYPRCIDGERACPPEDCHGVEGYAEFLREINDPDGHEHESSLAWIGGYFDPEHFNPELINRKFKYEAREAERRF